MLKCLILNNETLSNVDYLEPIGHGMQGAARSTKNKGFLYVCVFVACVWPFSSLKQKLHSLVNIAAMHQQLWLQWEW